jgi:hydroxypyruvate isomerase
MNRRLFLGGSFAALGAAACAGPSAEDTASKPSPVQPHQYHLRYAPRIGLVEGLSVPEQLDLYARHGFRAFEYNGLPQNHSLKEAAAFRQQMDGLEMEMGVFVVNAGGWKGDALVDKKFHEGFLKDVRNAVEYHKVMRNKWATVTSGLSVDYLPPKQQTQNVIEGLKRAAEIVAGTDLTLVLEPLNVLVSHPNYFVVTSLHAAEIIDAVGSPHVRILFDIFHQQISEGNVINNIHQHWDRIAYFQVGDVPGRNEPGTGEINYRNIFKAIHAKGFDGIVGMEHGLSQPGMEGLLRCFEEYKAADTWDEV